MKDNILPWSEFVKKTVAEIEEKTGKSPEQLYNEKEKRITNAITLKDLDRVPVFLIIESFVSSYMDISGSAAFYEPELFKQAFIKTAVDLGLDMCNGPYGGTMSGIGMEMLGTRQMHWPGGDLPHDSSLQFIDEEIMKPEEYDIFITDPTDYMIRYYLPRTLGALAPLSSLPPLAQSLGSNVPGLFWMSPIFATEEFKAMAQKILKAGEEQTQYGSFGAKEGGDMSEFGIAPMMHGGGISAMGNPGTPAVSFSFIADYLRGMKGTVEDMFMRPEKLLYACEKLMEWRMARIQPIDPMINGYPRRTDGGGTHWASGDFLNRKQFDTFVWPFWKQVLQSNIDMGLLSTCYLEGRCDFIVEHFLEFPKGTIMLMFEQSDLPRAKEILRDHTCIAGNVPPSLLQYGSTQDVEDYCRDLIKICGKGGGYILAAGVGLTREAKPENVKALVDSAEKYGRY